jgi:hypothetical protein
MTLTKRFGSWADCGNETAGRPIFRATQQEKFGLRAWPKWTLVAKTNMLALGVWGKRV